MHLYNVIDAEGNIVDAYMKAGEFVHKYKKQNALKIAEGGYLIDGKYRIEAIPYTLLPDEILKERCFEIWFTNNWNKARKKLNPNARSENE